MTYEARIGDGDCGTKVDVFPSGEVQAAGNLTRDYDPASVDMLGDNLDRSIESLMRIALEQEWKDYTSQLELLANSEKESMASLKGCYNRLRRNRRVTMSEFDPLSNHTRTGIIGRLDLFERSREVLFSKSLFGALSMSLWESIWSLEEPVLASSAVLT